ncbi:MAG: hypothetical protein EBU46_00875 [Nitrosomonadaceae bacterium]|nr:hypothetical protein [Nitrosomonadaceae bacterium]
MKNSLIDLLKAAAAPLPQPAPLDTNGFSREFNSVFVKTAADHGCSTEEIKAMMKEIDENRRKET